MDGSWPWAEISEELANTIQKVPEELVFHLDASSTVAISQAISAYNLAALNIEVRAPRFLSYGKTWISSHSLHPDAFVQVILQYAYFKTHGKPAPTYETATLRQYYHGRTETVRSCTEEAMAFVRSMTDHNKGSAVDRKNKLIKGNFLL